MFLNPTRKPNSTYAAKHLTATKPIAEKHILPPQPTCNYKSPMPRLSFGVCTAKEDMSIRKLHYLMTRGPLDPSFIFPDTGFITTRIQEQLWEFGNRRVIVFPEIIAGELSGWIENPIHNLHLHGWLPRALEKCRTDGIKNGPLYRTNVFGTVGNQLHPFNVAILNKKEMTCPTLGGRGGRQ